MTSVYLLRGEKVLLLYRQGGRVVNNVWTGSAGGHFESYELNDAKACVQRELYEELGLGAEDIEDLALRYITLRRIKGEIRQNYYFFANFVMEHFYTIGRYTDKLYAGIANAEKVDFLDLPEL